MYSLTCQICNIPFKHRYQHTKYCSSECRVAHYKNQYGRRVLVGEKISPGTVGAMAEMIIASDLMRKGYAVFRALSPSCYCDLIAVKNGKKLEVEVKTGYQGKTGGLIFSRSKDFKAMLFGIWERNTDKIYYLSEQLENIEI